MTSTPLGIEADVGLNYHSDDGSAAYVNYGNLQPLDGLGYGAAGACRDCAAGQPVARPRHPQRGGGEVLTAACPGRAS